MQGTVIKFDEDRRYGFIRPVDGSRDIFFHEVQCRDGDDIRQGSVVSYKIEADRTGRTQAVSVDLV
jgi:cold shock CspA family protein